MADVEQAQTAENERLDSETDENAGKQATQEVKGLEFLEEIEAKHNRVLTELDELNERIEKVLDEYQKSRKSPQHGDADAVSPKSEAA